MTDETTCRPLGPGDAGFREAVSLVREARICRGNAAALELWKLLGLPWVDAMGPMSSVVNSGGEAGVMGRAVPAVKKFLDLYTEHDRGCSILSRDLHAAYDRWAKDTHDGEQPPILSAIAFGMCVKKLGLCHVKQSYTRRNAYRNVRWRDDVLMSGGS
jgi:hypothetical protein